MDQAHRDGRLQLAPLRLADDPAAKTRSQDVELGLGHRALEPEHEAIVEVGRIVDAVLVEDQRVGQGADLKETVPVAGVPRQARDLEAHDDPDVPHPDLGDELPSACLRLPLRETATPAHPDVLAELTAERARLDARRGLRGRLALALLHHLADAPPLSDVARTLGLASRTLQARLRALGTSYQAEIDRLRVEVATRYLQCTDEPIALIGARVGFTAPAAFTRFVRAATGRSPRDLRRERGAATG